MEARFKFLAHRLMRGEDIPHGDVQYERGFFAGARFILKTPALTEAELKKALEQQAKEK